MKYAFVFLSILAIWLAIVVMAAAAPGLNLVFAQELALVVTVVLFVIGFGGR